MDVDKTMAFILEAQAERKRRREMDERLDEKITQLSAAYLAEISGFARLRPYLKTATRTVDRGMGA